MADSKPDEEQPLLGGRDEGSFGGGVSSEGQARRSYSLPIPRTSVSQQRNSDRPQVSDTPSPLTPMSGTFLDSASVNVIELTSLDNPVAMALHKCRKSVIRPYNKLLLVVGWQSVFDDPSACWQHFVNWLLPLFVVMLVLVGYVIQIATCFKRDSSLLLLVDDEGRKECRTGSVLVSLYIIPDVLHSVAYIYSFYLLRFHEKEQLPTLMERVFLQTSPTRTGFLSQGKLIRTMRGLLYLGIVWILVSLVAQVLRVLAIYHDLEFTWLDPETEVGRIFLLIFMVLGFVALDIVYTAVVINYCVQCVLLIFYIEGLQEKIRQCDLLLKNAIREILEIEKRLGHLNYNTALAMSIVLFNLACMTMINLSGLFGVHMPPNRKHSYILASDVISLLLWLNMVILPVRQAARLSAGCNSLRKIGHEIRVRPFGYQQTPDSDMDGFLLYTSSLNMRAKLFLVPVKTWYLSVGIVVTGFVLLILFQ